MDPASVPESPPSRHKIDIKYTQIKKTHALHGLSLRNNSSKHKQFRIPPIAQPSKKLLVTFENTLQKCNLNRHLHINTSQLYNSD